MSGFAVKGWAVKGWCPDAWRPMMTGDGLLVRVRPRLGRLTRMQILGLCAASVQYGNGQIDATSRANLQIRGVSELGWPDLIAALVLLELVDPDPSTEARRNIIIAPDWRVGDDTDRIARALITRLGELPEMPSKVGFAIDAGAAPLLGEESADFRIERGQDGGLILRADGRATGTSIAPGVEADALIALARWFVETGGIGAGRMTLHKARLPDWAAGEAGPATPAPGLEPGRHNLGAAYGLPFGRIEAQMLADAVSSCNAEAVRVTPWRTLIFEAVEPHPLKGLLLDPAAPSMRADACPGLPICPQATVETRDLASRLVRVIGGHLHVSGCAKGCARARSSDVMLTGRDGLFDLAFHARADDPPARASLTPAQIFDHFGAV